VNQATPSRAGSAASIACIRSITPAIVVGGGAASAVRSVTAPPA